MFRAIDKWLPGYLDSVARRPGRIKGTRHLLFCVADHFEPFWQNASRANAVKIVDRWVKEYPAVAGKYRDADGSTPKHTFFYPREEYDEECVEKLAVICRQGFGEMEIHLHHRNDTKEGFRASLEEFRDILRKKHGLLGEWKRKERDERGNLKPEIRLEEGRKAEGGKPESADKENVSPDSGLKSQVSTFSSSHHPFGAPAYGFIHGNWALCNSRPDGDWCGVNEELGVLNQTGCYADFTFPSAPSPTQPRMVNAIYRAVDTPGIPGACDKGARVKAEGGNLKSECGKEEKRIEYGDLGASQVSGFRFHPSSLMLITGPLALDWRRRKWGVFPKLENGAITSFNPPVPERIDLWIKQHIHLEGRPEWVFVKVYTHGGQWESANTILGKEMCRAYEHLQACYNDGRDWNLHFVTAREMYNIVRAAEDGKDGSPGLYRDYEVLSPLRNG